MNSWYKIQAKAGAAEISIYEDIGGWGVSAAQFKADLDALGDVPVTVRINSPGGSVFDGLAIYNILSARGNVTTMVDGLAASSASLVFMAGSKRVMPEDAYLMIHNPWTMTVGSAEELRDQADVLDRLSGTLANIYSRVTGKAADIVRGLMNEETWINGAEAIAGGWATEKAAAVGAKASISPGRFNKAPAALIGAGSVQPDATLPAHRGNGQTAEDKETMKDKILALLGVEVGAREKFLASAFASLGVAEAAIENAQKEGKADFLAEIINARIGELADKLKSAEERAVNAENKAKEIADAAGVSVGANVGEAIAAKIKEQAAKEAAEILASHGIAKSVGNDRAAAGAGTEQTRDEIIATFNGMKPGPERSAYFAKHRVAILGA